MKRARYSVKLESELYDQLEETSEGILIEWYDDNDNRRLKIENRKRKHYSEDDDRYDE